MSEVGAGGAGGVVSEGKVGRAVFSSRYWKKMKRDEPPSDDVFYDDKSPVNISVHLLDVRGDEELAAVGDMLAANREPGVLRKFYGWAELTVAEASMDGREVRKLAEWWHADIVLPCDKDDIQERERHSMLLAAKATCRPRP